MDFWNLLAALLNLTALSACLNERWLERSTAVGVALSLAPGELRGTAVAIIRGVVVFSVAARDITIRRRVASPAAAAGNR